MAFEKRSIGVFFSPAVYEGSLRHGAERDLSR
jgi:hypothetical protein